MAYGIKWLDVRVALLVVAAGALPLRAQSVDQAVALELGGGLKLNFVLVHAGTFQMGSP